MLRPGGLLLMISVVLVLTTLGLAAANGANDVSKGIATLVGSGVTRYRVAVLWAAGWTVAGALAAAVASQALVKTFSGSGLLVTPVTAPEFLLAVACGAVGWLIVATRTGLPVSTTHALVGALIGGGVAAVGPGGVAWGAVATKTALPLLLSPLLALALLMTVTPLLRPVVARLDPVCVCVEGPALATPEGMTLQQSLSVVVDQKTACEGATSRVAALDSLHWISSGTTSFFRGLNDAPKILAIGLAAGATIGLDPGFFYAAVALAMALGSVVAGLRVTRTMAEKITRIAPHNGFAANVVTSILVGCASLFALPVSTTHVSSGAIIGIGMTDRTSPIHWRTVREMLLAWVVTLPVAAALAALTYTAIVRL
jgi:PiT family inorganic phosphate transporter